MTTPPGEPMDDAALVEALDTLGIDEFCPQMMALWPFVELAWTDQRIGDQEREEILHLVRSRRSLARSGVRTVADWLSFHPSDKYLSTGRRVARALSVRAGDDPEGDPSDLITHCQTLARETARVFGRKPVPVPADVLREVAELLHVGPRTAWTDVEAQTGQTVVMRSPFADVDLDEGDLPDSLSPPVRVLHDEEDGTPTLVHDGEARPLDRDEVTIGRGPDNDLVLGTDVRVSRHHCRIENRDGQWFVVDLDSANGTHVDGQFVLEAQLQGGEQITVGDTELAFEFR